MTQAAARHREIQGETDRNYASAKTQRLFGRSYLTSYQE